VVELVCKSEVVEKEERKMERKEGRRVNEI
jgi:hypothetical protein